MRTQRLLAIFNWQGGTIHQIVSEVNSRLNTSFTVSGILYNLNDEYFEELCHDLTLTEGSKHV